MHGMGARQFTAKPLTSRSKYGILPWEMCSNKVMIVSSGLVSVHRGSHYVIAVDPSTGPF